MNQQTWRVSDVIDGSPLSALQVRVVLLAGLALLLMGWRRRVFAAPLPAGD